MVEKSRTKQKRLNKFKINSMSQKTQNFSNLNKIGNSSEGVTEARINDVNKMANSSNVESVLEKPTGLYNKFSLKQKKEYIIPIDIESLKNTHYQDPYNFTKQPDPTTAEKYAKAWFNEKEFREYENDRIANITGMLAKTETQRNYKLQSFTLPNSTPITAVSKTEIKSHEKIGSQEFSKRRKEILSVLSEPVKLKTNSSIELKNILNDIESKLMVNQLPLHANKLNFNK